MPMPTAPDAPPPGAVAENVILDYRGEGATKRARKETTEGPGRPMEMPPKWAALADACGGRQELAKRLDVSTFNLWKWGQGGALAPWRAVAVETLAIELGIPSPLTKSQQNAIAKAEADAQLWGRYKAGLARSARNKPNSG